MSHYTRVKTKIKNKSSLVKALQDMGFTESQIKVHDTPQQLEGYEARLRKEKAEIILPRSAVGGASNDIGFKRLDDGTFEAIISDYDRNNGASHKNERTGKLKNGYNQEWLDKLTQRYAYQNTKENLSENGLYIISEEEVDGELILECGRYG